jgi:transposase InsO family protein
VAHAAGYSTVRAGWLGRDRPGCLPDSHSDSTLGPEWIADTGATYHTTPDPGILTSVRPPPSSLPSYIMVANGSCLPVTSVGAAGPLGSFRMPDVLVAPFLVHNLLSIRRFTTDNSCSVEFDSSGLTMKDSTNRRPLLRCDSTGPLYTIRLPHATSSLSSSPDTTVVFAATTSSTTWHRRLGHPERDALMQLTRSATIPCTRFPAEHLCHACQLGRHVRLPFSSSSSHATHAFDLVHYDLWTSAITSMSGYKYYLVVLDDFSHYVWTFPLRAKSETFPTLRHFFAWVSTQFGLTIKAVQCDNGREFDNSASRDFFLSHGMQLRMSCPYTSSQNGKPERMILTTNNTIRTLLLQAHLPAHFWAEALHTSTYLLNRLPSTACPAPLLTRHSSVPLRAMTTSVSSGVFRGGPRSLAAWATARGAGPNFF